MEKKNKVLGRIDDYIGESTDPRIDPALIKKAQAQLGRVKQFLGEVESSLGHSWSGKYRMSQLQVKILDDEVKKLVKDIVTINAQTR